LKREQDSAERRLHLSASCSGPRRPVAVAWAARADIRHLLQTSERSFGPEARRRYRQLIEQALRNLSRSSEPPGSLPITELSGNYRIYHIRFARLPKRETTVRHPRHALVYRIEESRLIVVRVLHERQLIPRNVEGDT
jgi:toxin ParE1/3/4